MYRLIGPCRCLAPGSCDIQRLEGAAPWTTAYTFLRVCQFAQSYPGEADRHATPPPPHPQHEPKIRNVFKHVSTNMEWTHARADDDHDDDDDDENASLR